MNVNEYKLCEFCTISPTIVTIVSLNIAQVSTLNNASLNGLFMVSSRDGNGKHNSVKNLIHVVCILPPGYTWTNVPFAVFILY